jgi:hypothetical protein
MTMRFLPYIYIVSPLTTYRAPNRNVNQLQNLNNRSRRYMNVAADTQWKIAEPLMKVLRRCHWPCRHTFADGTPRAIVMGPDRKRWMNNPASLIFTLPSSET